MSGGMVSRSGAKPSAGWSAPPTPLRPSTKGSSIRFKNWSVSWNPTFCEPVAASPESCESALVRLLPVNPKRDTNAGDIAPPLLKKPSIAWPTLSWLTVKVGSGGVDGCPGVGGNPGMGGSGGASGVGGAVIVVIVIVVVVVGVVVIVVVVIVAGVLVVVVVVVVVIVGVVVGVVVVVVVVVGVGGAGSGTSRAVRLSTAVLPV